MIGIYKFTNKINGMSYIGQSVDIERRYKQHKRINTDNTIFHNAIREYGFEAFDFEIIELCTKDSLDEKEKIYIKKYNTVYPKGYNIATGGHTGHPVKLNPDNDLKEIIELLETTDMTNEEIGSLHSVSSKIISMINTGRAWHDDNINYPIRKRNKYFCKDCGKKLVCKNTHNLCRDCWNKRKPQPPVSKNELYNLLCKHTFTYVGEIFNVSDNTIRKRCDKYNIPRNSKYYRNIA